MELNCYLLDLITKYLQQINFTMIPRGAGGHEVAENPVAFKINLKSVLKYMSGETVLEFIECSLEEWVMQSNEL